MYCRSIISRGRPLLLPAIVIVCLILGSASLYAPVYLEQSSLPAADGFMPVCQGLKMTEYITIDRECALSGASLVFKNPNKEAGHVSITTIKSSASGRTTIIAKRTLFAPYISDRKETRLTWSSMRFKRGDRLMLNISSDLPAHAGLALLSQQSSKTISHINNELMISSPVVELFNSASLEAILDRLDSDSSRYRFVYDLKTLLLTTILAAVIAGYILSRAEVFFRDSTHET